MSEVCFLGSGGAVATRERDNTSFLLEVGDTLVLLDCPGSVIQKIKKLDYDPLRLKAIIITHIHPDHVYGLPSFVHSLMLEESSISLYGSEATISFCQRFLDFFDLMERDMKFKVNFIPVQHGEEINLSDGLKIKAYKVSHVPSSLAFHFFLMSPEKEIIYSGDTALSSFLFKQAEGIDYLIHDCSAPSRFFTRYPSLSLMHTHSLELGAAAERFGIKCLIPCHFFGELEYSISEIEEEIKRSYRGKLIIPSDFDKIKL